MSKEYTLIGGNGTRVSPLEVTESGTYEAGDSRAFNPVKVNVPSGSSTLVGLTDVDISNPANGQTLVYDAATEKWVNGSGGGGGIVVLETTVTTDPVSEESSITLDMTAEELHNTATTRGVLVNVTESSGGVISIHTYMLGTDFNGIKKTVMADNTTYDIAVNQFSAYGLSPNDPVVLIGGGK